MIKETTIIVPEASDPLQMFRFWTVDGGTGARVLYDFTGVDEIHFYGKKMLSTPLADAFLHYTLTGLQINIEGAPTNGVISIQFAAADLGVIGTFRHRLDVVKVGRSTPIMAGPLVIQNL